MSETVTYGGGGRDDIESHFCRRVGNGNMVAVEQCQQGLVDIVRDTKREKGVFFPFFFLS